MSAFPITIPIPNITASCIIPANAKNDTPVSICAGTTNCSIQIWGSDPSAAMITEILASENMERPASITDIDCISESGSYPLVTACDSIGRVGIFVLREEQHQRSKRVFKLFTAAASVVQINRFRTTELLCVSETGRMNTMNLDASNFREWSIGDSVNDALWYGGNEICVAGYNSVSLWDVRTKNETHKISGTDVNCLSTHTSRPHLIACGGSDLNPTIQLLDLRNNSIVQEIRCHEREINKIKFHAQNPELILSASEDGTIQSHSLRTESISAKQQVSHVIASSKYFGYQILDTGVDLFNGSLVMYGCEDETVVVDRFENMYR